MQALRHVLVPLLMYGGHYAAATSYLIVILWGTSLALESWGCGAAIATLLMWPVTLIASPLIGIVKGSWWVMGLGLFGLVVWPVGAFAAFITDRLLEPREG